MITNCFRIIIDFNNDIWIKRHKVIICKYLDRLSANNSYSL